MEYAYKKLLEREGISVNELPEDAKLGIETINQIERGIAMLKKSPRYKGNIPAKTIAKIKANDKWVVNEILDYIDGKQRNAAEEVPNEAKEVIEEIKDANESVIENKKNKVESENEGDKIDAEIVETLGTESEIKMPFSTLKDKAPFTYDIIFNNYEAGNKNGVITSNYKILETEQEVFTITKK